jgi:hypothetical protein
MIQNISDLRRSVMLNSRLAGVSRTGTLSSLFDFFLDPEASSE